MCDQLPEDQQPSHIYSTKLVIVSLALLAGAAVLVAARYGGAEAASGQPGAIVFAGSGISLSPGDDWQRVELLPGPGECPPMLVGPYGTILVLMLSPDRSNLQVAVAGLRAALDANPKAMKDSFKQDSFTSGTGLRGIRVSYSQRLEENGRAIESRSYNYIVRNRQGRSVDIIYIAKAQSDAPAVHRMIRQTLQRR